MGIENPNTASSPDPSEPQPLSALMNYIPDPNEPPEKAIEEFNLQATQRARKIIADRKMDAVIKDRVDEEQYKEKQHKGEGDNTEPDELLEPEVDDPNA